MMQHKTVSCVIEKDGKFLLIKRLNRPDRGYWAVPGGHVDEGESEYETAVREMKEEVGDVELEKKPIMDFVHDVRMGHRHHAFIFAGKPSGEIRAGSDAEEAKWFTLEEMADLDLTHYTNLIFNRLFPDMSNPDIHNEH